MKVKVYTINAFGKSDDGGNPAGVVLNADHLSEQQMKLIAKKVGFSETSFVMNSSVADYKVRFFTPSDEVDLCGHATIATYSVLNKNNLIKVGTYLQETKAGILEVSIYEDGSIMMQQSNPKFFECVSKKEIAKTLNISVDAFHESLPPQVVSTGLRDLFIPIKTVEQLDQIRPDFDAVAELSKKNKVTGYHLFTMDSERDATAYCRNFAPLYDIDEEAATGTSSGALASYLYHHKIIPEDQIDVITFEQGYFMKRPSEINVRLQIKEGNITRVSVGGKATNMKEITIEI